MVIQMKIMFPSDDLARVFWWEARAYGTHSLNQQEFGEAGVRETSSWLDQVLLCILPSQYLVSRLPAYFLSSGPQTAFLPETILGVKRILSLSRGGHC